MVAVSTPLVRVAWWRRPVGHRALVVVSVITLLVWLLVIVGATWWVRANVQARVQLRHQSLMMRLPQGMESNVDVRSRVMTRLKADPLLAVPVHQTLTVRLPDTLEARTVVRTVVPVQTQFRYQTEIPVDTVVSMDVPVVSWLPAMAIKLPIRVTVPVDITVPISAQLPLALDLHAKGHVTEPLKVPMHTTLRMKVPLRAEIEAEVLSRTHSRLLGPMEPFPIQIEQALLVLPLGNLSWVRQANDPVAGASRPWP